MRISSINPSRACEAGWEVSEKVRDVMPLGFTRTCCQSHPLLCYLLIAAWEQKVSREYEVHPRTRLCKEEATAFSHADCALQEALFP